MRQDLMMQPQLGLEFSSSSRKLQAFQPECINVHTAHAFTPTHTAHAFTLAHMLVWCLDTEGQRQNRWW